MHAHIRCTDISGIYNWQLFIKMLYLCYKYGWNTVIDEAECGEREDLVDIAILGI